jgi:hypothetical protein
MFACEAAETARCCVVTAAATLGITAGTASADVANPQYSVVNYRPKKLFTCTTPLSNGVFG